ncbi:MAG TPA: hypothetical protein VGU66_22500 [Candidatus Elarobacter sp.]|nr:hypothetical protein [Candidatus Elarobacter sp.]
MDRTALPGIIFWVLFLPLAALELAKPDWYTGWTRADWISLGVAAGTLALAGITAWNVLVTQRVIGAEDRRHRQSLAPIVNTWWHKKRSGDYSLHIVNSGPGPALNVRVDGVVSYYEGREEYRHTIKFRWQVLSANLGNPQHRELDLHALPGTPQVESVVSIHARYVDMFGNEYSSLTTKGNFVWTRPPRLR